MLQRVMLDGIELPRLYIAENYQDAMLAKSNGIPFIRWTQGQDKLISMLLRPALERMFPYINWNMVLGPKRRFRTKVEMTERACPEKSQIELVDELDDVSPTSVEEEYEEETTSSSIADDVMMTDEDEDGTITESAVASDGERVFATERSELVETRKLDIQDYVGDMSSYVNLEILQRLQLMPAFIGDILECVKLNIGSGMRWSEGYNKRLGLPVGRFNSSGQLRNLVILDVSGSIPRGISATMISLVDTLRTQLSADLIITGSNSRFYEMGCTLPSPQSIRNMFGYGNESYDFGRILSNRIHGRHYGHVFSFGDDDTPSYEHLKMDGKLDLEGTIVEHVHHYHTGNWWGDDGDGKTGYAKWCHMLAKPPLEEYDTSWCKVMR